MPELKPSPACGSDNVQCLACTIYADENQDVHFHIACEACYTSGPIGDNGKIASDKWNSLPRRPDYNDVDCAGCPERRRSALTWGEEPPKVAGWYSWRSGKGQNITMIQTHIFNGVCGYWDGNGVFRTDLNRGEWAGPIPEPLEPEES